MSLFVSDEKKLAFLKTMEDLLSEMQDGESTHTRNFHCVKCTCVGGESHSRQAPLSCCLFARLLRFWLPSTKVARGVASLEWMEQRDKVWLRDTVTLIKKCAQRPKLKSTLTYVKAQRILLRQSYLCRNVHTGKCTSSSACVEFRLGP